MDGRNHYEAYQDELNVRAAFKDSAQAAQAATAILRGESMDVEQLFLVLDDIDQALIHFAVAPADQQYRLLCGSEPDFAALEEPALPASLAQLCPGCVLFLARAVADHYHLPLEGPRGTL